MSKHETAQIYGLIDPRDKQIHYVGSSVDAIVRLDAHLRDGSATPKTRWLADMKGAGVRPDIAILATVALPNRFVEEYRWIYLGRLTGWPLVNTAAMKTEKYTDVVDGVKDKVFVELDRGLTWDIMKKCLLDMHSLPYPWDIRYAMFVSFTMLFALTVMVSAIFLGNFMSDDLLAFITTVSIVVIFGLSIPQLLSSFVKESVDIVLSVRDKAALKQRAKKEVEAMVDEEMNKISLELSSWVAETAVHFATNGKHA